jgi:energy-converting hydrogenase Eha subunit E
MFIVAPLYINYDNNTGITYAMNMSIASIHLHGVQKQTNTSSGCHFGTGIAEHASYTRAECSLNRPQTVPDENHMAYPGSGDVNSIPTGYTEYFQARFTQESTSDSEITVITPDVLVRFYQAYLIAKDTLYHEPVARVLSVELPNVELSTIFLIICLLVTLLLAIGLTKYLLFMLKHRATMVVTPETKLDWMLQSLKEAAVTTTSPVADKHSFRRSDKTFSSTISEDLTPLPKAGTLMTAEFEAATYGALDEESQMLGQNRVRRGSVQTGHVTMARGHGKLWAQQSPLADQANSYLLPAWHAAYADHSSCCNR